MAVVMTLDRIIFDTIVANNLNKFRLQFGNKNCIDVSNYSGEQAFDISFPIEFGINKNFYTMGDRVIDLEDSRSIIFFNIADEIIPSLSIPFIDINKIIFHFVYHASYENKICYKISILSKYKFFLYFNLFMPTLMFSYFDFGIQGDCQDILFPGETKELDEGYTTEDVTYEFRNGEYILQ